LQTLVQLGVISVINENNTVVTDEIRFDNDTRDALVANLIDADLLVIVTDQEGLFRRRPAPESRCRPGGVGTPAILSTSR
jgi:glutamate 5-kinase